MQDSRAWGFPLFPLGIVALPTESVPLHVFEERYRKMIEECLRQDSEFGILWLSEQELKPVGCACGIDEVTDRMDDGRFDILARGTRPFRLVERQHELPYPAGIVEFLEETEELADIDAAQGARELYAQLVEQATDRELSALQLEAMDSYRMAATVDFNVEAKQELLELRSENARMRLLTLMLGAAIKRLESVERAQARARSNGKVRFG